MKLPTIIKDLWSAVRALWLPAAPPARPIPKSPHFSHVTEVATTPSNETVKAGEFYHVVYSGVDYWVLFRCPCGCGDLISLTLQKSHNPHWQVSTSHSHRPTLYPSVWRNKGCKSHFWVHDGSINWCEDSGLAPHLVRPDLYSPRQ
jgi:hypothetical protein